jgi:hypothetical protein
MTPTEDPTETLLTESLDRHAADAPEDHELLMTVHSRLRRRRTGRAVGAAVLAAAAIAATVTVSQSLSSEVGPAKTTDGVAMAGFRWESYKTAQVQVPQSWTYFVSGAAPCGLSTTPVVGRYSPWLTRTRSGCAVAVLPLAERQQYVWFDDVQKPGIKQYDGGWTEETREVGGVHISVLTKDDGLRERILDSAIPLTSRADAYGCEQDGYLPLNGGEGTQPPPTLGKVTAVDICEYWGARDSRQSSLISGSRLDGSQASTLASRIITELPSAPKANQGVLYCLPLGRKTIRLTVHGTGGGDWTLLFQQIDCTDGYALEVGSELRGFSATFTDLVFTGVHKPAQPSDTYLVPNGFTPPPR